MDRASVRILVLDDEPFTLKLHAHVLAEMGFVSSRTFERGALALKDLDGEAPDLIMLDLSMPEMDGIEFIRHLAKRNYTGSLILISGEDERLLQTAARLVRAHSLSVLGHLAKPLKPADLRGLLEDWERGSGSTPRLSIKTYGPLEVEKAIHKGEIVNYYQPKILVKTGQFVGVESLARWQHPEDGLVLPSLFIRTAEQNGLIEELTRITFRLALKEIRGLERAGLPLQVAVNLAASTLAFIEFADFAAEECERASVRPDTVVFEVTETQLIVDLRAPLEVLARLKLMRFSFSIDDFGTGYSSLSQLRNIPFDELKIDQTFVHRASTNGTARAIYNASLGLARQLSMKIVAEGVEDRADWDFVRGTECDAAQGYFIARAMPAAALGPWRENWDERIQTEMCFP